MKASIPKDLAISTRGRLSWKEGSVSRRLVRASTRLLCSCSIAARQEAASTKALSLARSSSGISVSSLADYELGNTKVIPVDKVVLMADIYNAPELMAWYCSSECLIGKSLEMPSPEIASVERTTMKLLKQLRQGDIEQVKEKLIDITADGIISKDEWADLTEILDYLDGLIQAARELKLIGSKLLNGGADDG